MGRINFDETIIRKNPSSGNVELLSGVTADVYTAGTTTPVTIYADRTSGTTKTNPITTGSDGIVNFWVPEGDYDVKFSDASSRITTVTVGLNSTPASAGAIPATYLANGAVGTAELADGAIATSNILDSNVTTTKITPTPTSYFPSSPVSNQEISWEFMSGSVWRFKYISSLATYKWVFVGGDSSLYATANLQSTTMLGSTYQLCPGTPTITVLRSGTYRIRYECSIENINHPTFNNYAAGAAYIYLCLNGDPGQRITDVGFPIKVGYFAGQYLFEAHSGLRPIELTQNTTLSFCAAFDSASSGYPVLIGGSYPMRIEMVPVALQ